MDAANGKVFFGTRSRSRYRGSRGDNCGEDVQVESTHGEMIKLRYKEFVHLRNFCTVDCRTVR